MKQYCKTAGEVLDPVLHNVIGVMRKTLGLVRNNFKEAEAAYLTEGVAGLSKMPLWSKIGKPVIEAKESFNNFTRSRMQELSKIGIDSRENENVMASMLNPHINLHGYTAKQAAKAKKARELLFKVLQETGDMDRAQAENFLKALRDLRGVKGDINRMNPYDLYPKEFAPFFDDILKGEVTVNQNSPFAFLTNMIHMGGRRKYLNTPIDTARKEWSRILGDSSIPNADKRIASGLVDPFFRNAAESLDHQAVWAANTINGVFETLRHMGIPLGDLKASPELVARMAVNMTSWYSGLALAARPALVLRNMTQIMLPATKVGYDRLLPALKKTYGKDRGIRIKEALGDLNIPVEGEQGVSGLLAGELLTPQPKGGVLHRIGRQLQEWQRQGLRPYRWADRVNNRVTTYWMGRDAVEIHGKDLINGKINWEQFLLRTGLKGSNKLDQNKMRALLLEGEVPQLNLAGREYGKTLVRDTQFIYNSANAPYAFQGTIGRMAGQFGTWPVAFTEFMNQNLRAGGDALYRAQFLKRYIAQRAAFASLGAAAGIDTNSYNFANPLTFQGGPWFQLIRDMSVLGSSTNEFDRRKAHASFSKAVGMYGTPFVTGNLSPFGGLATDLLQARGEEDWMTAILLSMGFNLKSNRPATSR